MGVSHRKIKSVAKVVMSKGPKLEAKVLATMKLISDVVGATLGPGGCPVLIERQEYGFPNLVTKDGVTVYRSLGFNDPIAQSILETSRDASVRTATEAGDGTTTATVLAEAIVRYTSEFCKNNRKASPQRVVRILQSLFKAKIEPLVRSLALTVDENLLRSVATCSANGDVELANAVMKCFELTGDDGNITIYEQSGPSAYKVETLKGYPVELGYEESLARFFSAYLNDRANARVYLEKPVFILNHGPITEIQQLFNVCGQLDDDLQKYMHAKKTGSELPDEPPKNVVLIATGFSESVIGQLSKNWDNPDTLNIVPLLVPKTPVQNGAMHFLEDIQAVTGAVIFDPIRRPLKKGSKTDVGFPLDYFEMHRYRSNIVGSGDESLLVARVEELRAQIEAGGYESEQELGLLKVRLGKLTGGIAKLTVVGASSGEIREKKDRADDAFCAVRGAIKHGALPGGCWTLTKVNEELLRSMGGGAGEADIASLEDLVIRDVLCFALQVPLKRLLENCGYNEIEIEKITEGYVIDGDSPITYDALEAKFVSARESGVMDSLPAVLEALRNSISVASLLGTVAGIVVFPRDNELERQEASDTYDFLSDIEGE